MYIHTYICVFVYFMYVYIGMLHEILNNPSQCEEDVKVDKTLLYHSDPAMRFV